MLRHAGRNLAESAELIEALLRTWPDDRGIREEITRREHEGDRLTHKVVNSLRRSKMTPFDREDIYSLAEAIDDVVDDIEEASEQLVTKRVEAPMEQAQQLAGVLRDSGREVAAALDDLESLTGIDEHLDEIRRLEREGTRSTVRRCGVCSMGPSIRCSSCGGRTSTERSRRRIDRCHAAANSIESIVVKHT